MHHPLITSSWLLLSFSHFNNAARIVNNTISSRKHPTQTICSFLSTERRPIDRFPTTGRQLRRLSGSYNTPRHMFLADGKFPAVELDGILERLEVSSSGTVPEKKRRLQVYLGLIRDYSFDVLHWFAASWHLPLFRSSQGVLIWSAYVILCRIRQGYLLTYSSSSPRSADSLQELSANPTYCLRPVIGRLLGRCVNASCFFSSIQPSRVSCSNAPVEIVL